MPFRLPVKLRLFLPVILIVTVVVAFITIWFVRTSIRKFETQIEDNLMLEVQTIVQMFEREANLKQQTVLNNLNVFSAIFGNKTLEISPNTYTIAIENQLTNQQHTATLNRWSLDAKTLNGDTILVDSLQKMFGGTLTIFQKTDSGFVRISTNVLKADGQRAVNTYIPVESPVVQTVLKGERYYGRALVVDDWYVSAYEPVYYNGSIEGMIYTGDKEKDLPELERVLNSLSIGISGYPFVFDQSGTIIIHPQRKGEHWGDSLLFRQVQEMKSGLIHYNLDGRKKTMAFSYYERFELYIAAAVFIDTETAELKRDAVVGAAITALMSIILLSALLYYFTRERLYKYLNELELSRKKLKTVSKALEESEERFKKLFDSTGDDIFVTDMDENIIEVNQAACDSHGYTRDELLSMKIQEIKSPGFKNSVSENRKIIFEQGQHTFQSEHVTKKGIVFQVEFTSRLVSDGNEKLILSVVRNISKRLEFERQILSAIIRGEERERQRFAREMHDGLGPLLSTIKLYVNELNSSLLTDEERNELITHSNELIDEAVSATRTISNNLMPTVIHTYGLFKAVQAFCDKVNKTNRLSIQFEYEGFEQRFDQDLELILFRVISELINNTIKHASASNVYILLTKREGTLTLMFRDDGVGFNTEEIMTNENKGMGLKNIISRIKSINGEYSFSSIPGNGFTIRIEINL